MIWAVPSSQCGTRRHGTMSGLPVRTVHGSPAYWEYAEIEPLTRRTSPHSTVMLTTTATTVTRSPHTIRSVVSNSLAIFGNWTSGHGGSVYTPDGTSNAGCESSDSSGRGQSMVHHHLAPLHCVAHHSVERTISDQLYNFVRSSFPSGSACRPYQEQTPRLSTAVENVWYRTCTLR